MRNPFKRKTAEERLAEQAAAAEKAKAKKTPLSLSRPSPVKDKPKVSEKPKTSPKPTAVEPPVLASQPNYKPNPPNYPSQGGKYVVGKEQAGKSPLAKLLENNAQWGQSKTIVEYELKPKKPQPTVGDKVLKTLGLGQPIKPPYTPPPKNSPPKILSKTKVGPPDNPLIYYDRISGRSGLATNPSLIKENLPWQKPWMSNADAANQIVAEFEENINNSFRRNPKVITFDRQSPTTLGQLLDDMHFGTPRTLEDIANARSERISRWENFSKSIAGAKGDKVTLTNNLVNDALDRGIISVEQSDDIRTMLRKRADLPKIWKGIQEDVIYKGQRGGPSPVTGLAASPDIPKPPALPANTPRTIPMNPATGLPDVAEMQRAIAWKQQPFALGAGSPPVTYLDTRQIPNYNTTLPVGAQRYLPALPFPPMKEPLSFAAHSWGDVPFDEARILREIAEKEAFINGEMARPYTAPAYGVPRFVSTLAPYARAGGHAVMGTMAMQDAIERARAATPYDGTLGTEATVAGGALARIPERVGDFITFGGLDLITRGPKASPNLSWLLEKAVPGITNNIGFQTDNPRNGQ